MNYLIISKNNNNNGSITIKDTITNLQLNYYGYTLTQAIKQHKQNMNIKSKHFEKIYI